MGDRVSKVRPGDRVLFGKFSKGSILRPPTAPTSQQEEFVLVWERDISCIIVENTEQVSEFLSRELIDVDETLIQEAERLTTTTQLSNDQINDAIALKRRRYEKEKKEEESRISDMTSRYLKHLQPKEISNG